MKKPNFDNKIIDPDDRQHKKVVRRTPITHKALSKEDIHKVDPVTGKEVNPMLVIGKGNRGRVTYVGGIDVPWHRECVECGAVEKEKGVKKCKKCGKKLG